MSFFNGNSRKISDCWWCSILKMLFSVSKLRELWSLWEKLHFNKMYATRYFNAFTCGIWLLQLLRCRNIFTQTNVLKTFHVCAWLWGKFYWHFLTTTFFHLATEKKFQSPVSNSLKKVNSRSWSIWVPFNLGSGCVYGSFWIRKWPTPVHLLAFCLFFFCIYSYSFTRAILLWSNY